MRVNACFGVDDGDGATAIAVRPQGFGGNVFAGGAPEPAARVANSVNDLPPSFDMNMPLPDVAVGPSPPERNVQPLRRKSHRPAYTTSGDFGSSATVLQPVEAFVPARIFVNVAPPSL